MGSDPPDVTDGRPSGNIFRDNTVTKTATGVRFKEADDTQCYGERARIPRWLVLTFTTALPHQAADEFVLFSEYCYTVVVCRFVQMS